MLKYLIKPFIKSSNAKYYTNIDECPILIYHKISNGDSQLTKLCTEGKPKIEELQKHWKNIKNQVLKEYGIIEEYKEYIRLELQICQCLEDAHVKGIKHQALFAEILQSQSDTLKKSFTTKLDISKGYAKVAKKVGFHIDPSKISIRMFYGYLAIE